MRNLYFYLLVTVLGVGCGRHDYKNCGEESYLYNIFHPKKNLSNDQESNDDNGEDVYLRTTIEKSSNENNKNSLNDLLELKQTEDDNVPNIDDDNIQAGIQDDGEVEEIIKKGIDYVDNTCIFGSANKLRNGEINDWSSTLLMRSRDGSQYIAQWYKYIKDETIEKGKYKSCNKIKYKGKTYVKWDRFVSRETYNKNKNIYIRRWTLIEAARQNAKNKMIFYNKDEKYLNINEDHKSLIENATKTKEVMVGNCHEKSNLFMYYIWKRYGKNNKLKKIELIEGEDFDHVFCILNRDATASLDKSEDWGENCFVIDPWAQKYYPSSKFNQEMKETLDEAYKNKDKTNWSPWQSDANHTFNKMKSIISINLSENIFPEKIDENVIFFDYPENFESEKGGLQNAKELKKAFNEHKSKFKKSLDKLKKIKTID